VSERMFKARQVNVAFCTELLGRGRCGAKALIRYSAKPSTAVGDGVQPQNFLNLREDEDEG
jgi:hypothetical protein